MYPNEPGLGEPEAQEAGASEEPLREQTEPTASTSADDVTPHSEQNEPAPAVVDNAASADADATAPELTEPTAATPSAETPVSEAPTSGIKRGELIEGAILNTSPTEVTVDVGEGRTGIISSSELGRMNRRMLEALKPGESITVYVVNPRDVNGNVVLSVNRAQEELDWKQAEDYRQSQTLYESRIAGYNKGGLIVRFGRLRGFVPQSQMTAERRALTDGENNEQRWSEMVNDPIVVKVMEVDRQRNRLILSERVAARESREKRKENLITELTVGEVREGRVVSLEDFGAFVDVGGAEGLVHLTELSWQHVNHPREVLRVGQVVKVEVISIDPVNKRIGLSVRRQAPDPWDTVAINYQKGQLVRGVVTKLTKFGAFARLVDLPDIEGLIHISELADHRVAHPREVVDENDELTLRVVKIDIPERRLGLSLKKVNSAEFLDLDLRLALAGSDAETDGELIPDAPPIMDQVAPSDEEFEAAAEAEAETEELTAEEIAEEKFVAEGAPVHDIEAEEAEAAAVEVEVVDEIIAEEEEAEAVEADAPDAEAVADDDDENTSA